ncbi:MAG: hypothetical protein ACTSRR_13315 [Candidatus Heimdallarchaeaceae archaeon]
MSDDDNYVVDIFLLPSSDLPPKGEYILDEYYFKISSYISKPFSRHIYFEYKQDYVPSSIKSFVQGNEIRKKVISSTFPFIDAFALGFSSSLECYFLVRKKCRGGTLIRVGSKDFGEEFKCLFHSLTNKITLLYKNSIGNENIQRFLRSLRKYRIALQNRQNSVEFFENMWISFEALFPQYKITSITDRSDPWYKFRKSVKKVAKNAINQLKKSSNIPQRILCQMKQKYLDAVDRTFLPIVDNIFDKYKEMMMEYLSLYLNLNLDIEKSLNYYLSNLKQWYKIRNELFHKGNIFVASEDEFKRYGNEIKQAVDVYYFMFLHVNGYMYNIVDSFPSKEQINNFLKLRLSKEKKDNIHSKTVPKKHRIKNAANFDIDLLIVFFLNEVEKATLDEIIAVSYSFGFDISNIQSYKLSIDYLEKNKIIKKEGCIYIKNFEQIEEVF